MGRLMNGKSGRKWLHDAFDGSDLKLGRYRVNMASSFAFSGEGGRSELSCAGDIYFSYADLFVWKNFCKISSFEQPCDQSQSKPLAARHGACELAFRGSHLDSETFNDSCVIAG
jgi:hypothetical protein